MINKSELWNKDIQTPDDVTVKMLKSNGILNKPLEIIRDEKKSNEWLPPIFLYHEERDEQNYVHGHAVYGGNGSRSVSISWVESREILTYSKPVKNVDRFINDAKRGEILSAFCKLEFCIDALVCIEMGAYEDQKILTNMQKELVGDRDGLFSTTQKKLRFLKTRGVIDRKTYDLLFKAKDIRNGLAHQYLPVGDFGITKSDIEKYGSPLEAVDHIFNACWFYVLQAYVKREGVVLKWLIEY